MDDSIGKDSQRLVSHRRVPRLVHLVASTVACFLGAFAGLIAALAFLHRLAPDAPDSVSITGMVLGFFFGGSAGLFCVRALLGAMDPPAAPDQVDPSAFEAALAELNKARGPLLRAVFTVATSALLGWFAYNRHAWLLLAVAWLGIGAAQHGYKVALAARGLGAREALPQSLADATPEFLRQLFDLAYRVTPPLLRRSSGGAAANARAMREIHAQAVQRTASLPASALMLSAYFALFALGTLAWSHRHSARASRHSARAVAAVPEADSR